MLEKNIEFISIDPDYYEVTLKPIPASNFIPEWWRAMPPYSFGPNNLDGKKIIVENTVSNASPKKCIPMLDAVTSGYIIPLWADVQVRYIDDNHSPRVTWQTKRDVFRLHQEDASSVEAPEGYHSCVFKFMHGWRVKTPPGYSCLFVQPFGFKNTGIHTVTAIVDTDKDVIHIPSPVWFKDRFDGIIEKGTPIVQIIPFKRDNWSANYSYMEQGKYQNYEDVVFRSTLVNNYVRKRWEKKRFK